MRVKPLAALVLAGVLGVRPAETEAPRLEEIVVNPYPAISEWREFEVQVRDGELYKPSIKYLLPERLSAVQEAFSDHDWSDEYAFPVEGANMSHVIDWFNSSRWEFEQSDKEKRGHPGYDINAPTDSTHAVSMINGVVVSTNTEWEGKNLRGGVSTGIFNPKTGDLQYYAHLRTLLVEQGDIVHPGQRLGLIGRTGKNAVPSRSRTHLHHTTLRFDGETLTPVDFYETFEELVERAKQY